MDFLSQPYDLYQSATKGLESAWIVVKPDPGGKNNYLMAQDGDPNELWHMVDSTIRNAANRYNKFSICVAPNKNAMQTVIPVTVVANPYSQQNGNMAGIGSMPGYGYTQHADIGKLLDERDEKWKKELEHRDALRERDDKIAALEYENRQKKKKGDFWEQAIVFCQETGVDPNPLIAGLISKIPALFARGRAPMPGVAGLADRGRGGHNIHRQPADEPIPGETDPEGTDPEETEELDDNQIAMNESIYKELLFRNVRDERLLSLDYAKVIEAMIRLDMFIAQMQAVGMGKDLVAADLLEKVSDFIIEKPMEAQKLVQQMKGDTNEAGA